MKTYNLLRNRCKPFIESKGLFRALKLVMNFNQTFHENEY